MKQLAKKNSKNCEFYLKSCYGKDYKINSEHWVGMPQNDYSYTFLPRGGGPLKWLQYYILKGGGGSEKTPKLIT